ncbi:MAG: DUF504 domain-containing protein [Sulfuricella sp.]|nr:DUF504 domain-containing protein [Gammaproteobacteria bacterium]
MQTIQELLDRIRWDKEFGTGDFTIGYYDRVLDRIISVPLREVQVDSTDHFFLQVVDDEGEVHSVPYHRVKEVHKNGKLIWHREH